MKNNVLIIMSGEWMTLKLKYLLKCSKYTNLFFQLMNQFDAQCLHFQSFTSTFIIFTTYFPYLLNRMPRLNVFSWVKTFKDYHPSNHSKAHHHGSNNHLYIPTGFTFNH